MASSYHFHSAGQLLRVHLLLQTGHMLYFFQKTFCVSALSYHYVKYNIKQSCATQSYLNTIDIVARH